MVKAILGEKGSGKTKKLVDLVVAAVNEENGDVVVVETRRESIKMPSRVNDTCRPGVIAVTFHDRETLTNRLFLDAVDAASKEPEYKICAARIRKA